MYLWVSVILVFITVVFIVAYLFYRNKSNKTEKPCLYVAQGGKEIPVYSDVPQSKTFLAVFATLFLLFACMIIYFAFRLNQIESANAATPTPTPSPTPSAVVASSSTPEITASPMPEMPSLPEAKLVVWLDELTPYSDYKGNFTLGGWSDRSPFLVGGREYKHGIGMQICGTDKEILVNGDDAPDGVLKHTCKQTNLTYALRNNFLKLVFSIGVDANVLSAYGPKEENGEGRVVITDISRNGHNVLFDTDWVDYEYSKYEAEVPLKDVELLEITVMSKDYEKSGTKSGLRFAIVDPILFSN